MRVLCAISATQRLCIEDLPLYVSLDKEEYQLAKKEAKARGMAVRDKLPANDVAPWMRYAGDVESGDPNSSLTIDEIAYWPKHRINRDRGQPCRARSRLPPSVIGQACSFADAVDAC
jgi:hypothetical protein